MTPVTVACVWVQGHVPYTAEYVAHLAAAARRTLGPVPVRCLTDRPEAVPDGVEAQRILPFPGLAGWWNKLWLFDPVQWWPTRVLYLDLDTLIVGDLRAFVDWPAPFVTLADEHSTFQPRDGRVVIKRFNSSVMVFDPGIYPDLFTAFSPPVADRLWGDQDWLAERHPEAATVPVTWCPRVSTIGEAGEIGPDAKVILSKVPKNAEASARWPWFAARWRQA